MSGERSRQRRAVVKNALLWGAAWGLAGGGIIALLTLLSPGPGVHSLLERLGATLLAGVAWGVRFGVVGSVVGTLFATALRLSYRGRRLGQISVGRFTLLGAVVGGVGVPLYLQLMNVLTGGRMIAWGLVRFDTVLGVVFGAAAAAGSILVARRAGGKLQGDDPGELEPAPDSGRLAEGSAGSTAWNRKKDGHQVGR
jgi:MFS family permease